MAPDPPGTALTDVASPPGVSSRPAIRVQRGCLRLGLRLEPGGGLVVLRVVRFEGLWLLNADRALVAGPGLAALAAQHGHHSSTALRAVSHS
jgi:hypothetical protein